MTIWHMRIACGITKPTNLHTDYAIIIVCPLQHCLQFAPQCYSVWTLAVTLPIQSTSLQVQEIASLAQSVASATDRRSSDVQLNSRAVHVSRSDS